MQFDHNSDHEPSQRERRVGTIKAIFIASIVSSLGTASVSTVFNQMKSEARFDEFRMVMLQQMAEFKEELKMIRRDLYEPRRVR